jgi:hypothetical protein
MKLRKYLPELIVLVYAMLFLLTKNPSRQWDRVIVSDGKGYYAYLPALFIYHDTDYGFIDRYEAEYFPASKQLYKDFRYDTGHGIINKYFPGPAILWLPFFGIGHAAASLFGFPTDGYSIPYQLAIAFAAFFYLWLSLLILRKTLRFYTENENAIAWSLAATALATNLVYYTVNAGCLVHVYNFFLVNAFVYFVLAACKNGKPAYYASAAFMLGMVMISRPQNGLIVLAIPFLCGSRESFLLFFKIALTEVRILLLSALALLLPLLVPITYWFIKTGHFLVYSYGNETYDLTKPHLLKFLFSFEKGWLLYTPIAAFAALGLLFLFRKSKWQFVSLSAFLFFLVYFMSSWWIWTYTSYVSQRVMIDYYVFIAILLIFTFKWFGKRRKRILLPVILSGFILLNLMQHMQQLIWVYPAGPVTAKTYFGNFFSFSRGTTYMIPENEVLGKQSYGTGFESAEPLFSTSDLPFSPISHSGKNALAFDSVSQNKTLFIRAMADYKEVHPLILKIGAWYKPETTDSSLTIDVNIGTFKAKYSTTHHNLMPGLRSGKWKYAEMAVYLPYFRSVSDSLFISVQNGSKGKVLMDDLQVDLIKMQGPELHDWVLSAPDPVDTATLYHTDLEKTIGAPWVNPAAVSSQQSFSGKKACSIQLTSPYSVGFEKELDLSGKHDGYFRVGSRVSGDSLSEVLLVFDFVTNGKTVFYKTYPVTLRGNSTRWQLFEVFREFPVARLMAEKVKIYYWYLKGNKPVYIDDMQVDIVNYKPAEITGLSSFPELKNTETLLRTCCDFEKPVQPESGLILSVADAYSGSKVNAINQKQPFSHSIMMPMAALRHQNAGLVDITAQVNSDYYTTNATLVADFKHEGKSFSYHPAYLRGQTIKGQWSTIHFGVNVPEGITARDSVLVYFYLPATDEEFMIDDFCVSLKNPNAISFSIRK